MRGLETYYQTYIAKPAVNVSLGEQLQEDTKK